MSLYRGRILAHLERIRRTSNDIFQGVDEACIICTSSEQMGHSKSSTMMDIYGHLIPYMHDGLGNQIDEWLTPIPVQMGENLRVKQEI